MRSKLFLTITLVFVPVFLFAQHSYVGVKTCGMCHRSEKSGNQLGIWKNSQHSKAFETLLTEKADKVAKDKGLKTKASESPECLKCHVTGYNVDASLLGKKFKMEDGVQCETCHGPGSDYKKKSIMEDKDKAIANGLLLYKKPEELCIKCHNEESPFYKEFKFTEFWDKIKHPISAKN
ncbi:perchlorate reductase subunit gamma precursor [bacterium BMS3Abin03]|nr:perchlorate reductase subunit gamma precursor [bacterium BMS3Abin03]